MEFRAFWVCLGYDPTKEIPARAQVTAGHSELYLLPPISW